MDSYRPFFVCATDGCTHPLDQAHSAMPARHGQIIYVVCGFHGCGHRRRIRADRWATLDANRIAQEEASMWDAWRRVSVG